VRPNSVTAPVQEPGPAPAKPALALARELARSIGEAVTDGAMEVSTELGVSLEGWKALEGEDDWSEVALVLPAGETSQTADVGLFVRRDDGRLRISGIWAREPDGSRRFPQYRYWDDPSLEVARERAAGGVTVSARRDAARAGKDVMRRFVSAYFPVWAREARGALAARRALERTEALTRELEKMGLQPYGGYREDRPERMLMLSGPGDTRLEVEVQHGGVSLKMSGEGPEMLRIIRGIVESLSKESQE